LKECFKEQEDKEELELHHKEVIVLEIVLEIQVKDPDHHHHLLVQVVVQQANLLDKVDQVQVEVVETVQLQVEVVEIAQLQVEAVETVQVQVEAVETVQVQVEAETAHLKEEIVQLKE